jgi:NAD(P)-dependent dehydrogenase (short-subunit alcohol dehydrogenase family)
MAGKNSIYKKVKPLLKIEDMFNLSNRVVLITGGAGKMGQHFAISLGLAGANVILADTNPRIADAIADSVSRISGKRALGIRCEISNQKQVKDLFKRIKKEFGKLDVLINNVMAKPKRYYAPMDKYPPDVWKQVCDTNLMGTFLCCREAFKLMKEGGSIIITSSTYGVVSPDQRIYKKSAKKKNIYGGRYSLNTPAVYSTTKAGLINLARHLATIFADKGIRVNAFTPGGVYDGQDESFHENYVKRTPLARMAVWSDYTGPIIFLSSDASRYMTGANLIVDGGWTAW